MTLIEVVAAIAILGSVLVGVVLAQSRHTRQLAEARLQHEAAHAADELIAQWWTGPEGVPDPGASGEIQTPSGRTLTWSTSREASPALEELGTFVLRVEFTEAETEHPASLPRSEPWRLAVDLVLPDPEWEQRRLAALRRELEAVIAEAEQVGTRDSLQTPTREARDSRGSRRNDDAGVTERGVERFEGGSP